jgi:Peptidase family M28
MPGHRSLRAPFHLAPALACMACIAIPSARVVAQESLPVRERVPGWSVVSTDQAYSAITPGPLMADVEALAAMSRHYRDNGHPQFWGRIIGTEADDQNAQWMIDRFRSLGLSDVRQQMIDLSPQWMPRSWSVTLSAHDGSKVDIATAQPTFASVGTAAGGVDLEAVWVGMASDAELSWSPDVRGKAVFFYSIDTSSRHVGVMDGAVRRLSDRGAAAIFIVQGIPGNLRTQFYPVNSPVPTFSLGQDDGFAARDFIAKSGSTPASAHVDLQVEQVPGLHSSTVWATLPGISDERVYVAAHRDGWFEGANDNAAGVATELALAKYFAGVPRAQRRRTIVFLGTTGHHNTGPNSGAWFAEHPELFDNAALLVNSEHTGAAATGQNSRSQTTASAPATWFASEGPLQGIVAGALDAFGVPTYPRASARPAGEIGRYFQLAPSAQLMTSAFVWHSDAETPESISPEGIVAITRAYAKVIADTDKVPLADLRVAQRGR